MKKLSIICALVMVFSVSLVQAQQYEVAPAGSTSFITATTVAPNDSVDLDIYLTGVTEPQNAGGVWIDFSGSAADFTITAGRCMDDGAEGCTGLWTAGAGANIPTPAGPGTHMLVVANLGGADQTINAPSDGLLVGTASLTNVNASAADATVNFTTIPSVATWTPILDADVTDGVLVIETVCIATTDAECDDGLFCNGEETWDGVCGCIDGTPPDCPGAGPCTITCDEATQSCIDAVCNDAAITVTDKGCCDSEPVLCGENTLCAADFTLLVKQDGFYQPSTDGEAVTVKNKICLSNPETLIGGIQFDICELNEAGDPIDCLECLDCELTERTVMFDCATIELPNGCCRVIMFCKNPGCAINPGECDIVTVVFLTKTETSDPPPSEECGDGCIQVAMENVVASDYDGFEVRGNEGIIGSICPVVCGDVCPAGSGTANDCGDGLVDIYDIMCEVDLALTAVAANECQDPTDPAKPSRADVPTGTPPNCFAPDGEINILDIMVLIDMALNRQDCCSFYYQGIIY